MLTIELTGPKACGKTVTKRWLEENLPVAVNGVRFRDDEGNLIVKIVDPSEDAPLGQRLFGWKHRES